MDREDPNYGRFRENGGSPTQTSISPQDENTWSALSHASVLLWPVTGLLPVAPLIIWLLYRDRSPRVGFQALQSLWYQVVWLVIFTVAGAISSFLLIVTLGLAILLLAPLWLVIGAFPFVHQLYAAYRSYRGHDYRYPFIADRIDGSGRRF